MLECGNTCLVIILTDWEPACILSNKISILLKNSLSGVKSVLWDNKGWVSVLGWLALLICYHYRM